MVRRFLVTCLGDADEIFRHLYAQLRELGWVGPSHGRSEPPGWSRMDLESGQHVCAPLRDPGLLACAGACLDICASALRRRFCASDAWVHQIAEDLRSGKVEDVIGRLKRLRSRTAELRDSLQALVRYYSENAGRMRYDESVQRMTQATLEEPSVVRTQLTPAVSEYTTRLCRANRLTALAISARST